MTVESNRTDGHAPHGEASPDAFQKLLGYLNFSNGTPDAQAQSNLNRIQASLVEPGWCSLKAALQESLAGLSRESSAFSDSTQAESVVRLAFDAVWPAYRSHHADLLFHLSDEEFENPLFLARIFEAVLSEGSPWDETERIVAGALDRLNDFLGFRPLAVLENEQESQPYNHERHRPLPIYIRGAGAAAGPYQALIERTIDCLKRTPPEILQTAHLDPSKLDELAVDMRAHDHLHPVNKRTNYMFGEWDPHVIDTRGYYRRFILRKIILDALLSWMHEPHDATPDEILQDAGAVLCGTMLMASSVSGAGPDTYDSNVSLGGLLPEIAHLRDEYYARLMKIARGPRRARLHREAEASMQPFGHVRHYLNIRLSRYGAQQVQRRHLAVLYARMGFPEAAREQAAVIPSTSVRFETEIIWRFKAAGLHLDRGELDSAWRLAGEIEDLVDRGTECGALPDPWNILGFQGQFPLFAAREDAIPDQRIETLLEIMELTFELFGRVLAEAAAEGQRALVEEVTERFRRRAERWDRYATTTVNDLPKVSGLESFESAAAVSRALVEWRAAGEAAGDISFWRNHVEHFQSARAYAHVADMLLQKEDHVAAMGLLMQWLSQADEVGMEAGAHSIPQLLVKWLKQVTADASGAFARRHSRVDDNWPMIRRLFDYLEANAGEFWLVPSLQAALGDYEDLDVTTMFRELEEMEGMDDLFDEDDDENDLFGAAYDDVTFQDSAEDGVEGDMLEAGYGPQDTEFDAVHRYLEPRLQFITALARLWQIAAVDRVADARRTHARSASDAPAATRSPEVEDDVSQVMLGWYRHSRQLQKELSRLIEALDEFDVPPPGGDVESNIDFDMQIQMKFYLLHLIIATCTACRSAERLLACCLPEDALGELSQDRRLLAAVYRGVLERDAFAVRRVLPKLMKRLARKPLLYVSLENGGRPQRVLAARTLQNIMRFLLSELPRLGLLRETWDLLRTAFRMERESRPDGMAVTEFDRLFRIALSSSVECIVRSSGRWKPPQRRGPSLAAGSLVQARVRTRSIPRRKPSKRRRGTRQHASQARRNNPISYTPLPAAAGTARRRSRPDAPVERLPQNRHGELVSMVGELVDRYAALWRRHSGTVRLSTVEGVSDDEWNRVHRFISDYGSDLFPARMLALSNIRAILHNGVEAFLEYLDEESDPLQTIRVLDDLDLGHVDPDHVKEMLETIYGAVVEKFDRFVEYNTTTTQSDYGEQFFCLMDFLRVEAGYERDAWELAPARIAHKVLARMRREDAADLWEAGVAGNTAEAADDHLAELDELESEYGVRLPMIADLLSERFVKPLVVNRMRSLVAPSMDDARSDRLPSRAFTRLKEAVDAYLAGTSGSGIDVPPWLRKLETEADLADDFEDNAEFADAVVPAAAVVLKRSQLSRRMANWKETRTRKSKA